MTTKTELSKSNRVVETVVRPSMFVRKSPAPLHGFPDSPPLAIMIIGIGTAPVLTGSTLASAFAGMAITGMLERVKHILFSTHRDMLTR
jgi:hypothetical protein